MRVVPEGERLVPPFLCFICETHPQREKGVRVVDTQRNFDPPANSPLKGRKLICERCVAEAANLLGFHSDSQVKDVKKALDDSRRILMQKHGQIESFAQSIGELAEELFVLPAFDGVQVGYEGEQKPRSKGENSGGA